MPLFCRHNRLESECPICRREREGERRETEAARVARGPRRTAGGPTGGARRRPAGLRTRQMTRAEDDGYRNGLVPGVRATADAERLGAALAAAAVRLQPPGPYPEAETPSDVLVAAGATEAQLAAFREWAGRKEDALAGEAAWTAEKRFSRLFERLSFLPRALRYEFLTGLGASLGHPVAAEALYVAAGTENDPATTAAKRILLSGDRVLLERRAAALAKATEVPVGALSRAFAEWEAGTEADTAEVPPAIERALGLG